MLSSRQHDKDMGAFFSVDSWLADAHGAQGALLPRRSDYYQVKIRRFHLTYPVRKTKVPT